MSEAVISDPWACGSSVPRYSSATVIMPRPSAFRMGEEKPLAGSRRLVSALKTVPRPITTNVIVIAALACSVLGSSGPATSGRNAAMKSTNA